MSGGRKFILPEKVEAIVEADRDIHLKNCEIPYYTYSFTPDMLGTIVEVKCSKCGSIADVFDIEFDDDEVEE